MVVPVQGRRGSLLEEHDDLRPLRRVVDHPLSLQRKEGKGQRLPVQLQGGNPFHRQQAAIEFPSEQERRLVGPVVAGIRVLAIPAGVSGIPRQHVGPGKGRLEVAPGHDLGRHQFQLVARIGTHDALPGELLSPALGLPVPHHQVAVAQVARYAKVQHGAIQPTVESNGRVAQRTEGH